MKRLRGKPETGVPRQNIEPEYTGFISFVIRFILMLPTKEVALDINTKPFLLAGRRSLRLRLRLTIQVSLCMVIISISKIHLITLHFCGLL